jgi:FtsH-binding integral membrane protein
MAENCSWLSRFRRPVFLWWMAALATELAADWLFKYRELSFRARAFVGFLPALMWILVTVAFVRAVLKSDEFQQRIQLQALGIACVPTAILVLVFSGLERAGIYRATWSDVVSPFVLLLLIAYVFTAWRYR